MSQLHHTRVRNFVADTIANIDLELGEEDDLSDDEQEESTRGRTRPRSGSPPTSPRPRG
ncbi:unnamed protein product [Prorocentrum cordatum]|nr:unnamed protein product [Polarella glacialis]